MAVIQNRDLIIVGQQPWDTPIGSNCKDLALEFAKHNRVLYVNAPLDRRTAYQQRHNKAVKDRKRVIAKRQNGLVQLQANFWVYTPDVMVESINWIKPTAIFRLLNKINNGRFAKSIQKAVAQLAFKDFILFNDNDIFKSFHLKELLKPKTSVYYSRDYMIATPYWRKHGLALEPELIAKSDICVANSVYLANYCKQYNQQSYYVGQGCDFTLFNDSENLAIPVALQTIQKPILGYVGAILSIRLDENILLHLAQQKPSWSIVLVGPEDADFEKSKLHQLPNVHFLGAQKPETLPAYIKGFDVCLNPQAVNPLTIGNYPRKIDEYLAMGKPTIATKTDAMSIFEDHVYIADGKEQYVELAEQALHENSEQLIAKRIAFANTHTWENNAAAIYDAILTFEKQFQ